MSESAGLSWLRPPRWRSPETAEQAEAAAADVRGRLGYRGEAPAVGLGARVGGLGLLAFSWEFGEHRADGASVMLRRGAVAVVNGSLQTGRRRLTLAHEMGHCLFGDAYSTD